MSSHQKQSAANHVDSYPGEWVALTSDQTTVVAHSKNLKSALKQAHKNGEKFPHMVKAPNESTALVIL